MTTPVVISRIQNRRGTKSQLDALYPLGYTGISGYNPLTPLDHSYTAIPTLTAFGTGTVATITFASVPLSALPVIGASITVTGVSPSGYNGTYTVTAVSTTSISFTCSAVGPQLVAGTIFKPFTADNAGSSLQAGELALCVDTQQIFIGGGNGAGASNGTYTEVATNIGHSPDLVLAPVVITLPPQVVFTPIPSITYTPYPKTPFFNLLYSITDTISANPNLVGTTFSKNGELRITAVTKFTPAPPIPPFPALMPVTLTDFGTEVNTTAFDINFKADYDPSGTNIIISYMHNFPGNLTLSTGSVIWAPI